MLQPAIQISDPPDWRPVDSALERLASYELAGLSELQRRALLPESPACGRRGSATGGRRPLGSHRPWNSTSLAAFHLKADIIPDEFRAESMAASLAVEAWGKWFPPPRASRGGEVLSDQLRSAGAHVDQIVVYSSTDVAIADEGVLRRLADGGIQWVTVTSSAIARSWLPCSAKTCEKPVWRASARLPHPPCGNWATNRR